MDKKIAFIGSGNMGKAIIGGIVKSQLTAASNLHVFDIDSSKSREMAEQFGSTVATSATSAAAVADILFIAVKPNVIPALLPELKAHIQPGCIVISIAAGVTLATLEQGLSAGHKIIRVMPNTPALVNCGMSSITPNANITPAELESVLAIFKSFGEAEVVSEYLIHSVVAVSGSAPAYAFMFIEAMPMLPCSVACQEPRPTSLPPRLCWAQPRWCWRPASIRASSRIWSAHQAAPP